jgi:hypothetical protein
MKSSDHKMTRWVTLVALCAAALTIAPSWQSDSPQAAALAAAEGPSQAGEYQLKAAFIYNFAQFVEWPANSFEAPDSPIVIGVVGDDPFHGALERAVSGKRVQDHPLIVHHVQFDEPLTACHIVYFSSADDRRLQSYLVVTRGKPVLTIGEADRFLQYGGIIRFFLENNKIRFEVNVQAAQQAGLKISSKLLKLARIYEPER